MVFSVVSSGLAIGGKDRFEINKSVVTVIVRVNEADN
jgi:hypothetical protein